jgi:ELWxxDGT repeat protein
VGDSFFDFTQLNGTVYFEEGSRRNNASQHLWKTDGTTAGTSSILGGVHTDLTVLNGKLVFARDDGVHGNELWGSDGTVAGSMLIKDIYPGTTTITYYYYGYSHHRQKRTVTVINNSNPSWLTNVNGTLYFQANDGTDGPELWKSDGTTAGTVLVKDINPGKNGSSPSYLTNLNGTLFFSANDGTTGAELWKSDGTNAGTVLVKDINPGSASSNPAELLAVGATLYFTANDGTFGTELWQSDGTSAGTVLVADINPGSASSSPKYLTVVGGSLFFSANDGSHGYELWDPPIPAVEVNQGPARQPGFSESTGLLSLSVPTTAPTGVDAVFALAGPGDGLADGLAVLLAGPGFVSTEGNAISQNQATVTPAARTALADDDPLSGSRFVPGSEPAVDWFFASPHGGSLLDEWAEGWGLLPQIVVPGEAANKLA